MPTSFGHTAPVPGLVDMSEPPFADVGVDSSHREAFWYRRHFVIDGAVPAVALLKIHKAKYGMRVFLNGAFVADHLPCFTPAILDVRDKLKGGSGQNELVIRVGATRSSLPKTIVNGFDSEKQRYIPGLYDSVELMLGGEPFIQEVQAVPDIDKRQVRMVVTINNSSNLDQIRVDYTLRESCSRKVLLNSNVLSQNNKELGLVTLTIDIEIPDCRLWSPEDPFLYEVEFSTLGDSSTTRFGMRSFRFDPETGRAILNGKTYYMRGTNVCIFRFFEDTQRGALPWDRAWVRRLHQKLKHMHWNSIRYFGFPPDFWYEIADEEGLLIQDEFPIWYDYQWPEALQSEHLISEYTPWIRHRWNHPCVVIWDAQNESVTEQTGLAIQAVRGLDLSDRPWDNGWSAPQAPTDCIETHPYIFYHLKPPYPEDFAKWLKDPRLPGNGPTERSGTGLNFPNPMVINEYGWLWINRDGSPTSVSQGIFAALLGGDNTAERRRYFYARYIAAMTEYWRCHRTCAGVSHFCGLGYSRPNGVTSDNWVDVEELQFEPYYEKYVRDAFAPVGLMIDRWEPYYAAGSQMTVPVCVINDYYQEKQGEVKLIIKENEKIITSQTQSVAMPALERRVVNFDLSIPKESGDYQFIAELIGFDSETVRSLRDFSVKRESVTLN